MKVHIMSIGTQIVHAYTALRYYNYDKVYLIVGQNQKEEKREQFIKNYEISKKNAEELRKFIQQSQAQAEIIQVRAFEKDSLQLLLDVYRDIKNKEKNNEIYINITGGTNLMGSAALIAAYFYHANAYYVLNPKFTKGDLVVELPVPKITYADALPRAKKTVLKMLYTRKDHKVDKKTALVDNKNFKSIQAVNPHLEALADMNLVRITKKGKMQVVELTPAGEIIAKELQ